MAEGSYEGMDASSPELRRMFTLDAMLDSDWYGARLAKKQERDVALWSRHVSYLEEFSSRNRATARRRNVLDDRLEARAVEGDCSRR